MAAAETHSHLKRVAQRLKDLAPGYPGFPGVVCWKAHDLFDLRLAYVCHAGATREDQVVTPEGRKARKKYESR